jgi:hypothetical protein
MPEDELNSSSDSSSSGEFNIWGKGNEESISE